MDYDLELQEFICENRISLQIDTFDKYVPDPKGVSKTTYGLDILVFTVNTNSRPIFCFRVEKWSEILKQLKYKHALHKELHA